MDSPPTKKFIATFLLLATVVAALATAFSFFEIRSSQSFVADDSPPPSSARQNAFVEPLTANSDRLSDDTTGAAQTGEVLSNNLTDRLAQMLAGEIVSANPSGPQIDQNGISNAAAPDPQTVLARMDGDASNIQKLVASRMQINKTTGDLPAPKIIEQYTTEDLQSYVTALHGTIDRTLGGSLSGLLDGSPSQDLMRAINLISSQALLDLQKLPVPKPLAEFHEKFLNLVLHLRNTTDINFESTDPLLELTALQSELDNLQVAIQDLATAQNNLMSSLDTLNPKDASERYALAQMLGIPVAHADLFGADIPLLTAIAANTLATAASTATTVGQKIVEFAKKVALSFLKDNLVHQLVAKTITWIQGDGKPQFITNWKGFLKDTVKLSVDETLSRFYPGMCQSFAPLIRQALTPKDFSRVNPSIDNQYSCTIEQVVADVKAFAQSFEHGGWIAYAAALNTNSSFFGSLIQMYEITQEEALAAAEAARNDALASNGYTSQRECVKYGLSIPDGNGNQLRGPCLEWRNTSPGHSLAGMIDTALSAPLHRIVNADDLAALSSALANAALSKLISLGKNAISKGVLGVNPTTGSNASDALRACNAIQNPVDKANCVQDVCSAFGISPCPTPTPPPTNNECQQENCGAGCLCKTHDGLTPGSFCFLGDVASTQDEVLAEYKAGPTPSGQIDPVTGLINAPFGGCTTGTDGVCVGNHETYKNYVASKLRAKGLNVSVGEEICIVGSCDKAACSLGSAAGCPRPNPAGFCLPTGQREECTKIESSFNTIMRNVPNGICPAP